jgi:hypothetical protein
VLLSCPLRPTALANEAGIALVEPHPSLEPVPLRQALVVVVLTGRATSVPFTPVMTGPQRTLRDNTTAAVTCADHRFPW